MESENASTKRYRFGQYEGYESRSQRRLQQDLGVDDVGAVGGPRSSEHAADPGDASHSGTARRGAFRRVATCPPGRRSAELLSRPPGDGRERWEQLEAVGCGRHSVGDDDPPASGPERRR